MFTHAALGFYDFKHDREFIHFQNCDSNSVFDLASLTKLFVTAPLIADSEISGIIDPTQPVENTLDFQLDSKVSKKNVRTFLSHSSGLPAWHNFWINRFLSGDESFEALSASRAQTIRDVFQRITRYRKLNASRCYSDLGYILLGYMLENFFKKDLADIFEAFLLKLNEPLLLGKIGFSKQILLNDFIATGYCALRRRKIIGEVHDENAASIGGVAGHSGLFGTLTSTASLFRALIGCQAGKLMMQQSQFAFQSDREFGYGFHRMNSEFSRVFANGKSWGHLGFTGCGLWYDPVREKLVIILSNRSIFKRINPLIKDFRCQLLKIAERL